MKFLLLVAIILGAIPAYSFQPDVKNGECVRWWNKNEKKYLYVAPEEYKKFYERLHRNECYKEWLVLIYMAADNDLSPYSFRDLWEMETVGSTAYVDVLIFHDHQVKPGMFYYHLAENPNGKKRYAEAFKKFVEENELQGSTLEVQEDYFWKAMGPEMVNPTIAKSFPEGDSGSAKTAGDFISWAIQNYPSKRLMLVGWSHSEGFDASMKESSDKLEWVPLKVAAEKKLKTIQGRQGGFALDNNPDGKNGEPTHMHVTEMSEGLAQLLKTLRNGEPVDILGTDACLNQQVEFASQWGRTPVLRDKPVAQYIYGSANIVQKKGFNYHILLDYLKDHSLRTTTYDLVKEIPKLYARSVSPQGDKLYRSYPDPKATMSVWNVEKMEGFRVGLKEVGLKSGMEAIGQKFLDWVAKGKTPQEKLDRTERIKEELIKKVYRYAGISNDFYHFLLQAHDWVNKESKVNSAFDFKGWLDKIEETRKVLVDSIEASHIGAEYIQGIFPISKGVSVWFPLSKSEANEMLPKFRHAKFFQDGKTGKGNAWERFVSSLYAE